MKVEYETQKYIQGCCRLYITERSKYKYEEKEI